MISKIESQRQSFIDKEFKCIPFKLDRLNKIVPGIIKGSLDCITANSSVGKTTLAKKLYVYDAIEFAIENNINLQILYFGLEESEEEFDFGLFSYLVYKHTRIRSNITDFSSFITAYPKENIDKIKQAGVEQIFNQYKSYVKFYESVYNSWGIYIEIRNYARSRGTFYNKGVALTDADFIDSNPSYDKYVPNNDEFVTCIIDHVSELMPQRDEANLKMAIDKLVQHMRLYVSKLLKYNVLCIQQQDSSQESVTNKNANYMKPKLQGLGDSKTTGRAYINVFGLFNPIRYEIKSYGKYDVNSLDKYFRIMNIIKQRYGSVGEEVPLFFDGKCANIVTMPRPEDNDNMKKVYDKVEELG